MSVVRDILRQFGPARVGIAMLCIAGPAGVLAACSTGAIDTAQPAIDTAQPETSAARAPGILERIRALDLLPRQQASENAKGRARQSRAEVFGGDDASPIVQLNAAEAPASSDGYDLNFENAPVTTVAKVILGDILGAGYTIDPRVQGTITLASGRPVPKSDILYVLENALRMSNVALVHDRSGYRLLPVAEAVGTGRMDSAASAEAGYGTTVIPLRYVSAQTIMKLLDSFAVKPGMMRVDASRNILMLQGSGAERRNALETVLSFDADWMRGQSVGIYPIRNSTPEPIMAEIEKIMDSGEGGLSQNLVKFQAVSRLNAILVVSRKPDLLKKAGTWIARLDQSDTSGDNLKVYHVRYGNARQVAALLTDIFVGRGTGGLDSASGQIAPGAGLSTSSSSPLSALSVPMAGSTGAGSQAPAGAGPRSTSQSDSGAEGASGNIFGSGKTAAGAGGGGILPGVRITADAVNNSILVYANQEAHRIVEQTLRQIDRPQLQVAIDATIAEVTLNNSLNYGVQFFLKSSDVGLGADKGSIINSIGGAVLGQTFPGFNFLLGSSAEPRLILDALHSVTDVKVLSNPSLVVLDNQPATLQVGDEVPVATGTATVLTANNTVVNTISYRNTGIILRVVPRINSNGNVILDIEQEISNVATSSSSANSLTPTVSQRRVKSSIAVTSGQTVLLAGLISENENRDRSGVPLLDQIPGLGDAFSHQNKTMIRTELIIFIRPQIIRNAVDANVVAEELRAKLNGRFVGSPYRGSLGTPEPVPPVR